MSMDFRDAFGGEWVIFWEAPQQGHWRWMRVSDGAKLEVTPTAVDLHGEAVHTDDPAEWLAEHLGAPPLDFGDLDAVRFRRRMDDAFERGWAAAASELNPGPWSYPDRKAHAFRSVPTWRTVA